MEYGFSVTAAATAVMAIVVIVFMLAAEAALPAGKITGYFPDISKLDEPRACITALVCFGAYGATPLPIEEIYCGETRSGCIFQPFRNNTIFVNIYKRINTVGDSYIYG